MIFLTCAAMMFCATAMAAKPSGPPAPKPLSKSDIIDLLKGDVPPARVKELVREKGINFQLTPEAEDELRHAGATSDLLATLRELAPKAPGIEIEVTPGDAEVYVDDERVGKTSPEGRLKISKLAPGDHRIRLSLDGYKDFENTINLKPGESANVTTQLQRLATGTPSGSQADTSGGDVRALLDKLTRAVGGSAKIRTIRGFRLRGNVTLYLAQGATPGELETVFDFSGRAWQRFTTSSAVFSLVVTPTSGFMSSAAGTQDIPIIQRNELLKNVWRNVFYVLQHLDDPTFSFMAGGTAVVGGVTAEVLDVAGAGTESRWFIDPKSGFLLRASWMDMGTTPGEIVDDYTDWQPVGGIFVPFRQTSTRNGQMQSAGAFTGVEVNPSIDSSLFYRPGR